MIERRRSDAGLLWGGLLIVVGGALLLQALGFFPESGKLVAGILIGAGGLAVLGGALARRLSWGVSILGAILTGTAATILVEALWPGTPGPWSGAIFLGATGMGFVLVFLRFQAQWWALLTAGVLLSLALASGLTPLLPGPVTGGLFFLALAATFAALALVPAPGRPRTWAWFLSALLAVIGVLSIGSTQAAAVFWPLVLIVGGAYLIVRALLGRRSMT